MSYWAGERAHEGFNGVRLLLLGESAYDEGQKWSADDAAGHASAMVRRWGFGGEGYQRFFANVLALCTGADWRDREAAERFWQSVYFYNYVTEPMAGGARVRPTEAQFRASDDAFHSVLEEIQPQAILVLGKKTWQSISDRGAEKVASEQPLGDYYLYRLDGGAQALAAHVRHPSASGFSSAGLHEAVDALLRYAAVVRR